MKALLLAIGSLLTGSTGTCRADILPPEPMLKAMAPNGELIVRINQERPGSNGVVSVYKYDAKEDRYVRESAFELHEILPHQLFLSDAGDIVLVSYSEKDSINLYSQDGALRKAWDLADFLNKSEIKACAETESSIQWLDEGRFHARTFHFWGPSPSVRDMPGSYTVKRGANLKMAFSGSVSAETQELVKEEAKRAKR